MRYLTSKGLKKLGPFCLGVLAAAAAVLAGLGWVGIFHPLWLMLGLGAVLLLLAGYLLIGLSWALLSCFRAAKALA
ncbi:MAG: hypothetical protein PHY12_09985 [Eubacteriales bacterium]|nr:hypothetical protein [Eubacteriales bacterium]